MIRMLSCSLFRVPPLLAGSLVSIHDMSFSLGFISLQTRHTIPPTEVNMTKRKASALIQGGPS